MEILNLQAPVKQKVIRENNAPFTNKCKDSKKFCQRIKPLFSNKQNILQKHITIIDNNVTTSVDADVAEKLNNFFGHC